MRKSQAEKKFSEALDALWTCGEDPINYALSYVWGRMDRSQRNEYVHEFEAKRVTVTLSDYDDERPRLTLVK